MNTQLCQRLSLVNVRCVFIDGKRLPLLHWTQRHWGLCPTSKASIKRFSECGVKGVEVDQSVRGDTVEGQSASRTVHIHSYSLRNMGGHRDVKFSLIVRNRVTQLCAAQIPRLIIFSKHTILTVSSPSDSSVSHRYTSPDFPLDLPVTTVREPISTQKLRPEVKSLWMIRIWLLPLHWCHLLLVVRQFEVSVYCVCVHSEFTGIWRKNKTQHSRLSANAAVGFVFCLLTFWTFLLGYGWFFKDYQQLQDSFVWHINIVNI